MTRCNKTNYVSKVRRNIIKFQESREFNISCLLYLNKKILHSLKHVSNGTKSRTKMNQETQKLWSKIKCRFVKVCATVGYIQFRITGVSCVFLFERFFESCFVALVVI